MIIRIWATLMVLVVGGVWLLAIPFSPAPILKTGTVISEYRAMGLVPDVGNITEAEDLGHGVFEVPAEDAGHLATESAKGNMNASSMPGMKMEGQTMPKQTQQSMAMPEMDSTSGMKMTDKSMPKSSDMATDGPAMSGMAGMKMVGETMPKPTGMTSDATVSGGKMDMAPQGTANQKMPVMMKQSMSAGNDGPKESSGSMNTTDHGGDDASDGLVLIAQGSPAEVDEILVKKGIAVDTTSVVNMVEWGFDSGMVMVKPGQKVRMKITNTGNIPHEFMIMNMAAMNAINYRLTRPDWNLLEHEAFSEVPFIMPGDRVDFVIEVDKPGMWMYMCMFPYHMQMGMMGTLLTPDMMGEMNMGGMKM